MTGTEITIQVLTCSALAGLLGAVGLRLSWREITTALKQCRLAAILVVNFAAIPLLGLAIASGFSLRRDLVIALISNTWGIGSNSGEMTGALLSRLAAICMGWKPVP